MLYKIMKSGVLQLTLSIIMSCTYPSMKLRTIYEICEGLGISLEDFFTSPLFNVCWINLFVVYSRGRWPRGFTKTAPLSHFYEIQPLLQCVFPLKRRGAPMEDARVLDNLVQNPCTRTKLQTLKVKDWSFVQYTRNKKFALHGGDGKGIITSEPNPNVVCVPNGIITKINF